MTRPLDDDLGTVEGIVRTVEAMRRASDGAFAVAVWAVEGVSSAADVRAYQYATEAAHHARRLQGVAELADIVGFDAWFARWGDDCGR